MQMKEQATIVKPYLIFTTKHQKELRFEDRAERFTECNPPLSRLLLKMLVHLISQRLSRPEVCLACREKRHRANPRPCIPRSSASLVPFPSPVSRYLDLGLGLGCRRGAEVNDKLEFRACRFERHNNKSSRTPRSLSPSFTSGT